MENIYPFSLHIPFQSGVREKLYVIIKQWKKKLEKAQVN